MIYDLAYFLMKAFCRLLFRLEVLGERHIPRSGPVIIASNHVSYLDPIVVGVSSPRRLNYMAKEEIFKGPLLAWFFRQLQSFPVSRRRMSPFTIKNALALLAKGRGLLVFPEGTRGDGRVLQDGKPGLGIIAERSGAPVVPVYLHGMDRVLPRGSRRLRMHPIKVCFEAPLLFDGFRPTTSSDPRPERKASPDEFVRQVMARIEGMKRDLEGNCGPAGERRRPLAAVNVPEGPQRSRSW